jgi:hypothetical protein
MNEFKIIQNTANSALAYYYFTNGYFEGTKKKDGCILPLFMPVLPIIYHEKTRHALAAVQKKTKAGFTNLLKNERYIPVRLQYKMEVMADQSIAALNVALSSQLLTYNADKKIFLPYPAVNIVPSSLEKNKEIYQAATVLGYYFSVNSVEHICTSLNISF